jgi:hypothetical protein
MSQVDIGPFERGHEAFGAETKILVGADRRLYHHFFADVHRRAHPRHLAGLQKSAHAFQHFDEAERTRIDDVRRP